MSTTFRKATLDDLDALLALYDHVFTAEEAGLTSVGWLRGIYPTQDTIDAAVLDLRTAGAGRGDVDALTSMAVKLYARWQFDYRGKGEQYRQAYESLKAVLSLCPEYREDDGDG